MLGVLWLHASDESRLTACACPLGNRCAGSGMATFSPAGASASAGASISDGASSGDADVGINGESVRDSITRCARSPSVHPLFRPSSVRILKRISRASRHLAASKLASILVDVTQKNDTESWGRLFNFSSDAWLCPKGVATVEVWPQLSMYNCKKSLILYLPSSVSHPNTTSIVIPPQIWAKRVSSKLEEGDVRGALRIACSEDTLAELNEEALSPLRTKHPPQPPGSCFPLAPAANTSLPFLAEGEIVQALRSFPCNSAGGPDGLRPQHLVDLTSASAERGGRELLTALSSFILHILEGNTPSSIQPIFLS